MLILNVSTSFYYNFVGNFVGLFHKRQEIIFFIVGHVIKVLSMNLLKVMDYFLCCLTRLPTLA